MANPRIDQLDTHIPLDGDDLLHLYQADDVDRKASLDDHFAWLQAQPMFAPSLALGTFYVDAESGSDSADGRTLATAKKTINAILSGSLPPGAQLTILLKDGQTHTLDAPVNLLNAYVEINNVDSSKRATTILTTTVRNSTQVNAFALYNSSLFLNNLTIRTADATGYTPGVAAAMIISAAGGSGNVCLDPADIIIVDTPFIWLSNNGAGLGIGMSLVDISRVAGGSASPYPYFICGNGTASFNGQSVTLADGLTWKDLINDLSYGADHGPLNLLHNLGAALDQ